MRKIFTLICAFSISICFPAFSENRFENLRKLWTQLKAGNLSNEEYDSKKKAIQDSIKLDAQGIQLLAQKFWLEKVVSENRRKTLKERFVPSDFYFIYPHEAHEFIMISTYSAVIEEKTQKLIKELLQSQLGKECLERIKLLGSEKIKITEYCPKAKRKGLPGDTILGVKCCLNFGDFPPGVYLFSIYIQNESSLFDPMWIPMSKEFKQKTNILPFTRILNWLQNEHGVFPDHISQYSFNFSREKDCFFWLFYTETPYPPYDCAGRIMRVRADIPRVIETSEGHYWVIK